MEPEHKTFKERTKLWVAGAAAAAEVATATPDLARMYQPASYDDQMRTAYSQQVEARVHERTRQLDQATRHRNQPTTSEPAERVRKPKRERER